MKKLLSLFLALALILSLFGCSVPQDTLQTGSHTQDSQTEAQVTDSEETEVSSTEAEQTEAEKAEADETEAPTTVPQPTKPTEAEPTEAATTAPAPSEATTAPLATLDRNGSYTTKDDVALYIHLYGELPPNFITKSEARKLGWKNGSLEPYAPGKCIGGDRFYNREGLLPDVPGRIYTECDISTLGGGSRGAKRIVFSNDGLVYYTHDHYASFELLYGEP